MECRYLEIIEVLVKSGDIVNKNDAIVTLESDKSSVEVPSPLAGKISALKVKIGDKVSKGSVLALIESSTTKPEQESKEKGFWGRNRERWRQWYQRER